MAYDSFDWTTPDGRTQDIVQALDSTRKNLLAVRDAAMMGTLTGWTYQMSETSPNVVGVETWTNQGDAVAGDSNEIIRATHTSNPSGQSLSILWEYSSSPGVWIPIGTPVAPNGLETITYHGSGRVLSRIWS